MEGIQFLAAAIVAGLAAIGAGLGFGMMGGISTERQARPMKPSIMRAFSAKGDPA